MEISKHILRTLVMVSVGTDLLVGIIVAMVELGMIGCPNLRVAISLLKSVVELDEDESLKSRKGFVNVIWNGTTTQIDLREIPRESQHPSEP